MNTNTQEKTVFYKPRKTNKDSSLMYVALNTIIKSFLAGVIISLSSTAYLITDNTILGVLLFAAGIFVAFSYGFSLYTEKIGYCVVSNKIQNLMLLPIWVGNLIGAFTVGKLFESTRIYDYVSDVAGELIVTAQADTAFSILLLSFFCGILMFIAADGFKNAKNDIQKYLSVFLPLMVIAVTGFEHSVVNMFYYTISNCWSYKSVWYLIIMTVGNSLGSVLIPLCHMLIGYIRSKNQKNN